MAAMFPLTTHEMLLSRFLEICAPKKLERLVNFESRVLLERE